MCLKIPSSTVRDPDRHLPWHLLLLGSITLLGILLRCLTLSRQSLWLDEAYTVVEAGRPWPDLFRALFDPRQGYPLYILSMRLWITLFGSGEAALRWPSALAGTATVPLFYLFARDRVGRRAALLAAALLSFSPIAVWYAQEAKAYAAALLLSVATWLALGKALGRRNAWFWAGFLLLSLLSLLAHRLIAILTLLGQIAFLLLGARGARRRLLLGVALAVSLIVLWLGLGQVGTAPQFSAPRDPLVVLDAFSELSLHIRAHSPLPGEGPDRRPFLLPFAIVALCGAAALGSKGKAEERRFFVTALVVPGAAFFAFYLIRPLYYARYLLGLLPPYLLLLALGFKALWSWSARLRRTGDRAFGLLTAALGLLSGLLIPATSLREVWWHHFSGQPHKEQFREATSYLQEHVHPGDLVLVHPNYILPAVSYYAQRRPDVPLELYTMRDLLTEGYSFRAFEADMDRLTTGRRRAWLLLAPFHERTADPRRWVYEWFTLNPFLRCDEQHWVGLDLYAISFNAERRVGFPEPQIPLQASFGGMVHLFGADLQLWTTPVRPGGTIPLTLYVEGLQPNLPRLETVVFLVDEHDDARASAGGEPLGGFLPTSLWQPRDEFLDFYEIELPAGLPPGRYRIQVGYRPLEATGSPLLLPDGRPWCTVGEVEVAASEGKP
ncbi:MAG: glycosyltransferase family 39 protein [Chloroflexia bacterium]